LCPAIRYLACALVVAEARPGLHRSGGHGKRMLPAMTKTLSAPKQITWVICLVLYLVALLAAFGVISIDSQFALWSWILGFGLLLVATQVRDL
jgi:hypothetical protein